MYNATFFLKKPALIGGGGGSAHHHLCHLRQYIFIYQQFIERLYDFVSQLMMSRTQFVSFAL